ncbi:hypothetical protein DICVIV_11455 [Dictyocaulus viviparus]|uniref:Uncharacterized protein n=1 Tax=Dictyocaulus viviparus TaxID=29172 RepID=A0A0D8XFN1_DICVI|nr:hypothetical protein DICVIV_11455 [Dictyocaulus viviparus]
MDVVELSRDLEVKNKYPELYQMIITQRRFGSTENRDALVVGQNANRETMRDDDSKQLLYGEAIELLKKCRKQEVRQLREMQKNYDNLLTVNKQIKETYVKIYAKAEQEEEYISNILLKRIQKLKNDKETLAQKYEQEEEFLTNDLMRKIKQLQSERDVLEGNVKNEQANVIDSLLTTIRRMESEMAAGRKNMDRMRREKIDQENALEHEQELLFNTLGKQMDQLSQEKRKMQASLQKAYLNGFIEPDDEVIGSIINQSENNERIIVDSGSRCGSEVARLRSHLKRVEHQLIEMRERECNKAAQIRQLEDVISTLRKEKNEMSRCSGLIFSGLGAVRFLTDEIACWILEGRRNIEIALSRFSTKMDSMTSVIRPDLMGPPSVPPSSSRHNDGNVSDMDDSSSRGSLSQSDFSHELNILLSGYFNSSSNGLVFISGMNAFLLCIVL